MPSYAAILEDNIERTATMRQSLQQLLPNCEIVCFDDAAEMIEWLQQNVSNIALISLDHDLALEEQPDGTLRDFGTGRMVADFLATQLPTCPVIVHSSNEDGARGMIFSPTDHGWPCYRVYPLDEHEWIRSSWKDQISALITQGWKFS